MLLPEVALACVLIASAGLLLRSFLQVLQVDLGFEPERVSSIRMDYQPDNDGNSPSEQRASKFQEMVRQAQAIPGVQSVAVTDNLPFERGRSWDLSAKGRAHKAGDDLDVMVSVVTPGYLQTMGMRLKAGRDFNWDDQAKSERVIIINQAAARREWPNQDPIARGWFRQPFLQRLEIEILEVAGNLACADLRARSGEQGHQAVSMARDFNMAFSDSSQVLAIRDA